MKLNEKKRWIIAIVAGVFTLVMVVYFGGVFGQIFTNYSEWLNADGILGQTRIKPVNWNPLLCITYAFTANGLKGMLLIVVVSGIIFGVYTLYNRFGSKDRDPRGFGKVKEGTYGTASMMTDKELKENLELSTPENAEGVILGELNGKTVCMPKDTNLNRHIAIFGASGTMKSRAIIRNALFQALKNEESVVITDPKGELYADTAELYRQNGYEVKVFNLVNLEHSDSWNCMDDLGKDTLMSQLLASVIIGNTSSGKGDHFWDNGEQNLLKALVLYVKDKKELPRSKRNLSEVYASFTTRSIEDTGKLIDSLDFNYKTVTIMHTVVYCNVDGKAQVIAKDRTKTNKSLRTLPLMPEIEEMLIKMREEQKANKAFLKNFYKEEGYIYVLEDGTPVNPDYITKKFIKFIKEQQLRHIRFHDLRHSCATLMRHEGVKLEDIQKWLGHSQLATTEKIYAHFSEEQHKVSASVISTSLKTSSN